MNNVHFDALIGPTHHYAGLSSGNAASISNQNCVSHPKKAALQGIEKMRLMLHLGVRQAFFPCFVRPRLDILRCLGFQGSDADLITGAAKADPLLLSQIYSASSMWAANSATASSSDHTRDGRIHVTPANLLTMFHRSLEANETYLLLKIIFHDERFFFIHPPLPAHPQFADEGSANHLRLKEVELFVFGSKHSKHPSRQMLAASESIARLHEVKCALFIQQNPLAIDAGVFHNDVIAFSDDSLLVVHEKAYLDTPNTLEKIRALSSAHSIMVSEKEISLQTAIQTYLFNSQSIHLQNQRVLIAPKECESHDIVRTYLKNLNAFDEIYFIDLDQSMKNGGGPACLTLSIPMKDAEWMAVNSRFKFTEKKYQWLKEWIEKYYRDELSPKDLQDPKLIEETHFAYEALHLLIQKE